MRKTARTVLEMEKTQNSRRKKADERRGAEEGETRNNKGKEEEEEEEREEEETKAEAKGRGRVSHTSGPRRRLAR